jgi:hypothetical protein
MPVPLPAAERLIPHHTPTYFVPAATARSPVVVHADERKGTKGQSLDD